MAEIVPAREKIILAIDTSDRDRAEELATVAQKSGARLVKLGLEVASATSWDYCAELAYNHQLNWVADAKLHDIKNTVVNTVDNICNLEHPPIGITIHTVSGIETMRAAQERAGIIRMLGVTVLTSISEEECLRIYKVPRAQKVLELAYDAVDAGTLGVVCSPLEVQLVHGTTKTSGLYTMIPGSRSKGASADDQACLDTPSAVDRNGANLIVIGRQITNDDDPARSFEAIVAEIEEGRL